MGASNDSLPAAIVNGEGGDSFWKWPDFQLWRALDLHLGSGHTAYPSASLIDLYIHAKFHWNGRNISWTTGGRTYARTFETGFIRSTLSKSRPKNSVNFGLVSPEFWRRDCAGRATRKALPRISSCHICHLLQCVDFRVRHNYAYMYTRELLHVTPRGTP